MRDPARAFIGLCHAPDGPYLVTHYAGCLALTTQLYGSLHLVFTAPAVLKRRDRPPAFQTAVRFRRLGASHSATGLALRTHSFNDHEDLAHDVCCPGFSCRGCRPVRLRCGRPTAAHARHGDRRVHDRHRLQRGQHHGHANGRAEDCAMHRMQGIRS